MIFTTMLNGDNGKSVIEYQFVRGVEKGNLPDENNDNQAWKGKYEMEKMVYLRGI